MKTELIYFTGTGNTLFLAKSLATRLGDSGGEIILTPLASLDPDAEYTSDADRIGLFFPVYFLNIPDIVKGFMGRLRAPRATWIFAVSNCGQDDWGVAAHTRRIAKANGLRLDAFYRFFLPDNSIVFPTEPEKYETMFQVAETSLDRLAASVSAEEPVFEHSGVAAASIPGALMKAACFSLYGFKDLRCDDLSCTGCGLCARICPVGNIEMVDGRPHWLDRSLCTSCFGCLHLCPTQSITFRRQKKTSGYQYRNPQVTNAELMRGTRKRSSPD